MLELLTYYPINRMVKWMNWYVKEGGVGPTSFFLALMEGKEKETRKGFLNSESDFPFHLQNTIFTSFVGQSFQGLF